MKRKLIACVSLLLGVALLAGCIDDLDTEPETRSGLTVVNAFFEAEAVLHLIDRGHGMQRLDQGQRFGGIDFYAVLSCDNCKLGIISSNESAQLVDTAFALRENRYYTSFVFGTEATPRHFITEDQLPEGTGAASGKAGVRFYNLANTPRRVTLHIAQAEPIGAFSDRPTETPQSGRNDAEFIPTSDTGTHVLTVRDENGEQLARRTGVALDAGDHLTVFLIGDADEAFYYIGVVRHPRSG